MVAGALGAAGRGGRDAQRTQDTGFGDARATRTAPLTAGIGVCGPTARHFKKSLGHLVGGDATARFTVMEKLEHQYGADALSEALDVSESGFVAHCRKENRQRRKKDVELRALILQSFEKSRNTYGSPLVRLYLRELGHRCG